MSGRASMTLKLTMGVVCLVVIIALLSRKTCDFVDYDSAAFRRDTYVMGLLVARNYGVMAGELQLEVGCDAAMTVGEFPIFGSNSRLSGNPDWRLARESRGTDLFMWIEVSRPAGRIASDLNGKVLSCMRVFPDRQARGCVKRLFLEILNSEGEAGASRYASDLATVSVYDGDSSSVMRLCDRNAVRQWAERLRREHR